MSNPTTACPERAERVEGPGETISAEPVPLCRLPYWPCRGSRHCTGRAVGASTRSNGGQS